MAEEYNNSKKNNKLKYIILFVFFLIIGLGIGIYGTKKYMKNKEEDKTPEPTISEPKDITKDITYQEQIEKLYSTVNSNTLFYSSKGVNMETMDNGTKLSLIYKYLVKNEKVEKETLSDLGTGTCEYGFVLDPQSAPEVPSIVCTVTKISFANVISTAKELFNDTSINTAVSFNPEQNKNCIASEDSYICGNLGEIQSGELEIKFDIQKVTIDADGTISIYDKGYLVDRRAGISNPDDGYDNYYLHTSDSNEYYYELKSADNVTFKHIFKTEDNINYYYVRTEIAK